MLVLFALMMWGMSALWQSFPTESVAYGAFRANISAGLPEKSYQFYPNMRYRNRTITYTMESACTPKKQQDIAKALGMLEARTILQFKQGGNTSEITFTCADLRMLPGNQEHFVAGEGGPLDLVNTTRYVVILSGQVSLYRSEQCDTPVLALHETLHALGFDHSKNVQSIMYPVSECQQTLDSFIVQQINTVYREDPLPDLAIEKVTARAQGRMLSFDLNYTNEGLLDVQNVSLVVSADGKVVKVASLMSVPMGKRRAYGASNVLLPQGDSVLEFAITESNDAPELNLENNLATLTLSPQKTAP